MFRNYFKIAWRNLLRNKAFSAINISGLAIGMASAMLIVLWIVNEVSYDQFHEKKDRIYQVWNRATREGEISMWTATPKVLAQTIQADFPEIEQVTRVNWSSPVLFAAGEKRLNAKGNFCDSNFLQIFSFPLLFGNSATALNAMNNVVLTETLAKKLFGKTNAMGKTVRLNNEDNFVVSGILKDFPNNTGFQAEYLLPWAYLRYKGGDDIYWGNNSTETFALLKPAASLASINSKLKSLRERYDKDDPKGGFYMYSITRWRLYSVFKNGVEDGGRIAIVKLLGLIAAFILLIACINFMNLSTARSERRAKEVGIRKVIGAQKGALVAQFLGEAFLLVFFAGIVALLLVQLSLPAFNQLTDKKLFIPYGQPVFWFVSVGFVLFTSVLAGSYPAFFLSSFRPIKVLKGTFKAAHALVTPRKILVVLQFTFAITLIIATIIVKQQLDYAQARQAGYDKTNLIYHDTSTDLDKNYLLLKNELLSSGAAVSVTKTGSPLSDSWSNTWGIEWPGKDPNDKSIINRFLADDQIVKTAGLQLIQGRDLDIQKYPTDSNAILLNESAVKLMKLTDPLGQILKDNGENWHVVGVVKDFIIESPYRPITPLVFEGPKLTWFSEIHIKLNPQNSTAQNLQKAEAIFKKYNPEYPFDYKFVDQEYAKKFNEEKRTATLAALFAGLTIFISCLGLFGLAAYMAQNRIKEIGVRKVLGASIASITTLLSKDFLKLVIIALLIASPLAWWAMQKWLDNFDYRISLSWWVFAAAGVLSVCIALLTVGYQAVKAARLNPVKNLRTE